MADIKSMFSKITNGREDGSGDAPATSKSQKSGKQTIEQTYQKKTQLEHILLRPDTYIGSVEKTCETMWVYDSESDTMVQKKLEYVPGLYKIFDEILVNAADNKQKDKNMDCIKIEINQEENRVSVWNNGQGIPVAMHQEENMFVPTMIFGHLLTSSNYNDEEEKVTGGRNGYGAKLCNIFSTKFIVETASKEYKKQFKQTWGSNMTKTSEPKIKEFIGEDFTKITFYPDLQKFKMDKLEDDIVALMSRRAYDVAASTRGVKVFLNGRRLPIKSFKDYVDLYIKGKEYMGSNLKVVYDQPHERWEIAVTVSSDEAFRQISFVNSIATTKGGRHVDYVTDMVVKQLQEVIKKKNKGGTEIKPHQIKTHMWVFVNCLIANPTFDSQTKETMTLQPKKFGSKFTLSEKFVTNVQKSGIVEEVLSWAKQKEQRELEKKGGGKKTSTLKGIPKLVDANEAGKANSYKCTLILTEGDSAKTLAVSGLGVIGRDYYGVFPLRGKVLNVREATHKQIMENAEINNLVKIIGLVYKKKYTTQKDLKSLRYGKVMIMTDQDQDGSHIKGLLINFIHFNWPELLQLNFLEEFITPIVKARKKNEELSFYSLPEFEEWKAATANHHTYQIKYYKGLGTSTSKEAKEYFTNMERHRITFKYQGPEDDDHIVLAFSKKKVEERKEWLTNFMEDSKRRKEMGLPEKYLYTKTTKHISFKEFINLELVLFSNADNIRSIPSLVDGFKPGQRKVLFTCIKRNDKREVKVAQLAGSVAEHSAYHHGEVSLCATIVNLAQNFVGSNNINLLEPRGQFGTRLLGGKDSASPRYIFTKMSPLTRMLFHPHDDPLLKHEYDDNLKIEPVWYAPIIPMVLVNGADGIGTGWMTKIPNYNPREIVKCIKAMLNDEEPPVLHPWYKNFKGTIEYCGDNRYCVSGEIAVLGNKFEITELPVGTWTEVYKENTLEPMVHGNDKIKSSLQEYREYNTDTTIRFIISPLADKMEDLRREGLHKAFKLQSLISTTSMCCFDELNCLRKFDSVMDILQEFYKLRLTLYKKRKDYLAGMLEAEAKKLSNQARFIVEKCNGTLTVENKKRKTIVDELIKRKYDSDPILQWKRQVAAANDDKESDQEENTQEENEDEDSTAVSKTSKSGSDPEKSSGFNYILGMSMWMLTEERKNELLRQRDTKLSELKTLEAKTPSMLWLEDLDAFLLKLDEVEEKERADELGIKKSSKEKMPAKKKIAHQETMPSPAAERVMPLVSEEIKKKVQAAAKIRENKFKKIKKEAIEVDADDMFDAMIKQKSLADRIGSSEERPQKGRKKKPTDGLKQTKLNFPKKEMNGSPKKKGRKQKFDDSDDDTPNSDSDEDFAVSVPNPTTKERTTARRNAVKVTKYTISDDEESDDKDDDILVDNVAVLNESIRPAVVMSDDDSDSEKRPPPPLESSEDLFDSLVGARKDEKSEATKEPAITNVFGRKVAMIMSDSDSEAEPKMKAASKPKAAAKPRKPRAKKRKSTDSENEMTQKKKKPRKKSGNSSSSDVEFNIENDSNSPVQVQRNRPGRRAVPKKIYTVSDSD